MVSLHKALSQTPKSELPPAEEFQASQKKRKWEQNSLRTAEFFMDHTDHAHKSKSFFDIELHLKTPLPSDKWQQYLTLQSRMNMKTLDSRRDFPEQMSLDLELNLMTCEKKQDSYYFEVENKKNSSSLPLLSESKHVKKDSPCLLTPSWLSSDGEYKEMIATVCMRCHMLVMLCKSSPTCPNCKFMHPPDQNPSKFWKRSTRFSLLC